MQESRSDERSPASPDAQHWMAVTRQVQELAIKAQQVRDGREARED